VRSPAADHIRRTIAVRAGPARLGARIQRRIGNLIGTRRVYGAPCTADSLAQRTGPLATIRSSESDPATVAADDRSRRGPRFATQTRARLHRRG
jgi:hypothetical protein